MDDKKVEIILYVIAPIIALFFVIIGIIGLLGIFIFPFSVIYLTIFDTHDTLILMLTIVMNLVFWSITIFQWYYIASGLIFEDNSE